MAAANGGAGGASMAGKAVPFRRWVAGPALVGGYAVLLAAVAPARPTDPLPSRGVLAVVDLLPVVVAAMAALACWRAGSRIAGAEGTGWRLLGGSAGALALAAAWWAWEQVALGRRLPVPSPADVVLTVQVPLVLLGCVLLTNGPAPLLSRLRLAVDVLLLAGSVAFVGIALLLIDVFAGHPVAAGDVVLGSAHVLGLAVAAAVLLAGLVSSRGWRPGAYRLLLLGVAVDAATRASLLVMLVRGSYPGLHLVDVGWVGAPAVLAAAARRARSVAMPGVGPPSSFAPLIAVAAIVPAALLRIAENGDVEPVLGGVWLVVFVLLVIRQFLAMRENRRLTVSLEETVARRTGELRASEQRYRSVVDHVREVVFQTDTAGRWTFLNGAWTEFTGHPVDTSLGRSFLDFVHPHDRDAGRDLMSALLAGGADERRRTARYLARDGSFRWVETWVRATRDDTGAVVGASGTITDVTERHLAAERLRHQAGHDSLTGLANRRAVGERLARAMDEQGCAGLVVLDLDRFKDLNDSRGHAAGDQALIAVARRIQAVTREASLAGRLGGDEFAVVLADVTAAEEVRAVAERVRSVIDVPVRIDGAVHVLGASVGWVFAPADGATVSLLLIRADLAMYAAKADGGGVLRWTPELERCRRERLALTEQLREALAGDQLVLHYQPIVDLGSDRVAQVEALVRWSHPKRGLLAPGVFVPAAEESGLMGELTDWVLRQAARDSHAWRVAGLAVGTSVNLSATSTFDARLRSRVRGWRDGGAAGRLELEITESAVMKDPDRASEALGELSGYGVTVAIDDFGTGWSSLAQLKRLPVHRLKIDRSLVRDVATDCRDAAMLRAVVDMAHTLDLDVVAEGVEDAEVSAALRRLGCDHAQGWYHGRPMTAPDVVARLATAGPPTY